MTMQEILEKLEPHKDNVNKVEIYIEYTDRFVSVEIEKVFTAHGVPQIQLRKVYGP